MSIRLAPWSSTSLLESASNVFWSSESLPYLSSAALPRSPTRSAWAESVFTSSIFFLVSWIRLIISFSFCQWSFNDAPSSLRLARSFSIFRSLSMDALSVSFMSACFSISSCMTRRSMASISVGMESISIRRREAASSIRSIALSGRNLSDM